MYVMVKDKACKFNIKEGLVLLKLADTVLMLISTVPSIVKNMNTTLDRISLH